MGGAGQAHSARFANALQPRGDIDAVAHQVAVALLDDIAEMNADAELDAALWRHAGIALDHAVLHFDRASHRVDDAAELDKAAVAGALDDRARDARRWSGSIRSLRSPRSRDERAILVRPGEPAVTDDIGDQDRCDFRVSLMARPQA